MPSNRFRSRKSLGSRINRVRSSTNRSENTATPKSVGISTVSTDALAKSAVIQDAIASQAVDSTSLGLHSYQPSGETIQRVPAPLTDLYYWTKVTEGLVELHASGVHGDSDIEDIRNAQATKDGLLLSPIETEKARIYLTGRLPIPKSEKIYAQWAQNVENQPKLVYWNTTPEYFVEGARKADGVAFFDIDSASPALSVGDTVRVTETTPDFDGLYRIVKLDNDTVRAVKYTEAYDYQIADSSYNAVTNVATFVINQPELLANPSFDTDATSWSATGATIARTTSEQYAGAGSLQITEAVSQDNYSPIISSNVVVSAGKTYRATHYVKGPVGINVVSKIVEYDTSGNVVASTQSPRTAMTNSWVAISLDREMSSQANTAALSVSLSRETQTFDNVTFTFDSNTTGWNIMSNGTANSITTANTNTTVVRTGTASLRLIPSPAANIGGYGIYYAYIPNIQPNVTYGFSGWAQAISANTNVTARIYEYSDALGTIEVANTTGANIVATTGSWGLFHVNRTFTSSVQNAAIAILVGAGNVYIDDLQFRVSPYGSNVYVDEASVKDITYFDSLSNVSVVLGDTVALKEVTGAEALAGHYLVDSVDTTSNTSQVVFTANIVSTATVDNFYNSQVAYVIRGVDTGTVNPQTFSPFGKLSEEEYYYVELKDRKIWGARGYTHSVSYAELTQNVATIVSTTPHYAMVGDEINVYNLDRALGITSGSGVFDGVRTVQTVINANSLTYYANGSDTAGQNITSGIPYFLRINRHVPKEYAVYIEADANTSPVLYSSFNVFEIIGEPSSSSIPAEINNFSLTSNVVTLTLTSMPSIVTPQAITDGFIKSYNVSINAGSLAGANASNFNGTFTPISANLTSNTITYAVTHANVASEPVTGNVIVEVGIQHSEVNPGGFTLYDETGKIVSRLNTLEYNSLSIGQAQITSEGEATFGPTSVGDTFAVEGASTFESQATFNDEISIFSGTSNTTANLYGTFDQAGYHTVFDVVDNIVAVTNTVVAYSNANVRYTDILNRFARGLIYSVRLAEATEANYRMSTLYAAMGVGQFRLEKDRNYLFVVSTGSTRIITDTNIDVRMEFILTNTAPSYTLNTDATPSFAKKVHLRESGYNGTYPDMVFSYTSIDNSPDPISNVRPINDGGANVAQDYRIAADTDIYWMVRWATSDPTRDNLDFDRINPDKTAMFNIYDMGPATPDMVGNIDADSDNWQTTGNAIFAASGSTTATKTVTFNAIGSRSRNPNGTLNGNDIVQSDSTTPANAKRSQIRFPAFSAVPVLQEDRLKSGFNITRLQLIITFNTGVAKTSTYFGISASASLSSGSLSDIPTPIANSPVILKTSLATTNFHDLTSFAPYFQNGTARSILVGLENSTSNVYVSSTSLYQKFLASKDDGTSTNVQMRLTYTYNL